MSSLTINMGFSLIRVCVNPAHSSSRHRAGALSDQHHVMTHAVVSHAPSSSMTVTTYQSPVEENGTGESFSLSLIPSPLCLMVCVCVSLCSCFLFAQPSLTGLEDPVLDHFVFTLLVPIELLILMHLWLLRAPAPPPSTPHAKEAKTRRC